EAGVHDAQARARALALERELQRDRRDGPRRGGKGAALAVELLVGVGALLKQQASAGFPLLDAEPPGPGLAPRPEDGAAAAGRDLRVQREPAGELARLGEGAPAVLGSGRNGEAQVEAARGVAHVYLPLRGRGRRAAATGAAGSGLTWGWTAARRRSRGPRVSCASW